MSQQQVRPTARAFAANRVPEAVPRLRPNVLAHPSPTTGRFMLLIAALLSAGLLAGNLVHNAFAGDAWSAAALECFALAGASVPVQETPQDFVAHGQIMFTCLAPAERIRAGYSFAGAALIAVLSLIILLSIPSIVRRRRKLRPAGPHTREAAARIAELAAESGLRRPPRLLVGALSQRDAFVFGLPGRYYLVLPTALLVRWRNQQLFGPVVRHEIAHLRRHDVLLAWLAAAAWFAALPVLALPLVFAAIRWDFSLVPSYLWRAALLVGIVWLLRRQALRSREHDADLHAARQSGDWRPLCAVLETGTGKSPGWFKRLASHHPTVARRVEILTDPGRIRGVSFVDGLAAAFLTALLLPIVSNTLQVAFTGTAAFGWADRIAAFAIGPVIGLAVGVGLWRQALINHVTGGKHWPGDVVFGVVAGMLLGHWTGLSNLGTGTDWPEGFTIFTTVVVGAGAVLLSAGTGQLWADAAPRIPGGRHSWWIGFVVNGLIFGFALWVLEWLPGISTATETLEIERGLRLVLLGAQAAPVTNLALVSVAIAMLAISLRYKASMVPLWLVDGDRTAPSTAARKPGLSAVLLSGVLAGLLPAIAVLAQRSVLGPAATNDDQIGRYVTRIAVGVFCALAVSLVALVLVPRSGTAIGLVSGLVTAAVGGLGIMAVNTYVIGNTLELKFWMSTITTIAALWFFCYLFILPLSLVVWPASWRDVPGGLLIALSVIAGAIAPLFVVVGALVSQA